MKERREFLKCKELLLILHCPDICSGRKIKGKTNPRKGERRKGTQKRGNRGKT